MSHTTNPHSTRRPDRGHWWLDAKIAIVALSLLVACAPASSGQAGGSATTTAKAERTLSGNVTYRQRIALPAGAVITVSLDDVSLADAPATQLATATITTKGENVPIPFSLTYDPTAIRPERSYAVSARITIDDKLSWVTATRHSVLTAGNPSDDVTIVLQPSK